MPTILLVDDSYDTLGFMSYYLSSLKYDILQAVSPTEMFGHITATSPDLVILDVRLGGHNGAELCKKVKEFRKDLPVILSSASRQLLVNYRQYDADGIIEKPFELSALAAVVKKMLDPEAEQ